MNQISVQEVEKLIDEITKIRDDSITFFNNQPIHYEPANKPGSGFVVIGLSDYHWSEVVDEQKETQQELIDSYDVWYGTSNGIISKLLPQKTNDFVQNYDRVTKLLKLQEQIWSDNKEDYINQFKEKINEQIKCLEISKNIIPKISSVFEGERSSEISINGDGNVVVSKSSDTNISITKKNEIFKNAYKIINDNEFPDKEKIKENVKAIENETKKDSPNISIIQKSFAYIKKNASTLVPILTPIITEIIKNAF